MSKNPITLITGIVGVANSVVSIIKDKKKDATSEIQPKVTDFINEAIDKGVSLSSKRILNISGTALIVTFAVSDMTKNGIGTMNAVVLAIGVVYSIAMSYITYLSDRK